MMVAGGCVSSNYFLYCTAGLLVIYATTVSVQGILLEIVQMCLSAMPVAFQGKDYYLFGHEDLRFCTLVC